MSVHYKFKAGLDFSTVTFDGIHISVGDLKKEIIEQKRLGRNADFDLQIENAQTKEGKFLRGGVVFENFYEMYTNEVWFYLFLQCIKMTLRLFRRILRW